MTSVVVGVSMADLMMRNTFVRGSKSEITREMVVQVKKKVLSSLVESFFNNASLFLPDGRASFPRLIVRLAQIKAVPYRFYESKRRELHPRARRVGLNGEICYVQ